MLREHIAKPGAPVILYSDDMLGVDDIKGPIVDLVHQNIQKVAQVLGCEHFNIVYASTAAETKAWLSQPQNAPRVALAILDNDFGAEGRQGPLLAESVVAANPHCKVLWTSSFMPNTAEYAALEAIPSSSAALDFGPFIGHDHHYVRAALVSEIGKLSNDDIHAHVRSPGFLDLREDLLLDRAVGVVVNHLNDAFIQMNRSQLKKTSLPVDRFGAAGGRLCP